MKKQYIFILLILVMLHMIYLVLSYKYMEYKVFREMSKLTEINKQYSIRIDLAQDILKNRSTKAYKNKILKSQQGLKNTGEEVVFLISEQSYKKYTDSSPIDTPVGLSSQSLLNEESLIQTMTISQKWIYLILGKDTR